MEYIKSGFNNMRGGNLIGGSGNRVFVYIFVAIFVILIAIYLGRNYLMPLMPSFNTNFTPNNEYNKSESTNEAELMFFYADWCPHCKTAKPVWEELTNEYEGKSVNGYKVVFTEVNCTNENSKIEDLMNKYKIEGFPTIKLIKDGQVIEFDAKPSKDNLTQFLNTAL